MPELGPKPRVEMKPITAPLGEGDSSMLGGDVVASDLEVRFETFEQAQKAQKQLSDAFIEGAINGDLQVGGENADIKAYLDNVEMTVKDKEVIDDPERIAGLYLRTTEMLARNLKVALARSDDPSRTQARIEQAKHAKKAFITQLGDEAARTADEIVGWCRKESNRFPIGAVEYHGFRLDDIDVLDAESEGSPDVRPNFKIQRQLGGIFIMGYTDTRVREKMTGTDQVLDKRIYLNPDMEAAPGIFEQLLQAANDAGISLQLKMFQRTTEAAKVHRSKNQLKTGGIRGDGIVIYVSSKDSDKVLEMVLALARNNPDVFKGRDTSRIPQYVAEGIAVGDEPVQMEGTSLTTHREMILSYAAERTRESGKQGMEARELYRDLVRRTAIANGVNPENIAFNMDT